MDGNGGRAGTDGSGSSSSLSSVKSITSPMTTGDAVPLPLASAPLLAGLAGCLKASSLYGGAFVVGSGKGLMDVSGVVVFEAGRGCHGRCLVSKGAGATSGATAVGEGVSRSTISLGTGV